ncbi:hypothetical protein ES703_11021 [subsurface metagenome]
MGNKWEVNVSIQDKIFLIQNNFFFPSNSDFQYTKIKRKYI